MPGAPGIRSVVILAVLGLVRAAHAAPPHTPQNGVSCTSCHTLRLASRPVHGTVTAAADTTLTAAASWQPGQWVDLTITFTSGPNRGEYRRITGNTATAVTWTPPLFAPLVPGDTFTLGAAAEPTFATRCRSCHNPTGPAAATGRVDVHTVNGGATVIGCGKCHEPHANPPTPAQGQALLRRDLRWGGAAGPVAYPASATNDLIAGQAPYNGICETCHQQTAHHRNNPTADHTHMAPYACPDCHTHETGFASPPSGCSSCHGNPPADPTTLVQSPRATGSTTAGAHERHFQDQSYPCDSCHRDSVGAGTTHGNGKVTVGFSLFGGTYTGGVYDGQTGVAYDGTAGTSVSATGGKTCSQIYCHGQRADGTPWGGGQDTAPRWDGSVTCTSCHDMGGTATALSGRHRTHTNETTYQYPCDQCHNQTALGRSAIKDRSLHANNVKDVALTAGAYDSTAKGCSATTCHTDGRGGPPNVAPTWDAEAPGRCWACHSGTAADSLQMTTNGHDRLVSGHWVRRYPCSHCHSATVDPTTQQVSGATHVNGSVDVKVAPRWNIVGKPAPGYDPATKTCSNVYCHSDGTSVDPRVRTFTWLDQRTECNSCHGHPKGSCQDCHGPTVTGWPPGEEWKAAMPMYVNGGAGATTANTHMRHLLTNFTCDNCHYKTIVNGSCTDCHNAGVPLGSMREVNHIDPAYHVNKVKNVDFKDGGTYDPVTKTCRNTACHTGDDPQWGAAAKDEVLCFNCHGTTSADVDDFNAFNGTRARINMAEWVQTGHGRPTASGPYTSGNPPAAFPGNPCWYCHDNSVLHKDA
ncbi:MAG TPA: CxxxxCH/CxxCH domain-containing protein, partial [Polyangia bacterium]